MCVCKKRKRTASGKFAMPDNEALVLYEFYLFIYFFTFGVHLTFEKSLGCGVQPMSVYTKFTVTVTVN